jgi:hypothetical protein
MKMLFFKFLAALLVPIAASAATANSTYNNTNTSLNLEILTVTNPPETIEPGTTLTFFSTVLNNNGTDSTGVSPINSLFINVFQTHVQSLTTEYTLHNCG